MGVAGVRWKRAMLVFLYDGGMYLTFHKLMIDVTSNILTIVGFYPWCMFTDPPSIYEVLANLSH